MNRILTSTLLFLLVIIVVVFLNYDELNAGDQQTESTTNSVHPNYSVVFPNNKVNRIDIKISSKQWAAMSETLETDLHPAHPMPEPQTEDLAEGNNTKRGRPTHGMRPPMPTQNGDIAHGGRMKTDSLRHAERGRRPPHPGGHMGGPMNSEQATPTWAYCTIDFNNQQWNKVGIRFKGNSSLKSTLQSGLKKFSFKLDFDQFEDKFPEIKNQRFYGFKQLNLKNNYNDPSFMREKVAADLFTEFGVTSPATSFCEIFVDYGEGPQYFGMYTLVEEVDDTLIKTQYKNQDGNLYKPEDLASTFAKESFNALSMNKKNNKKSKNFSDVKMLNEVLNSSLRTDNYELWKKQFSEIFDVNIFLKYLAANNIMQNWDTYGNSTHNYYLYNNTETGKFEWIPWDNNEALQHGKMRGALPLSLNTVDDNWPLIRYIIDDEEWKAAYENYLTEFVENVFTSEKATKLYDNYQQLLQQKVIGAHGEQKQYSFLRNDSEFNEAVKILKNHVEERHIAVMDYLQSNNTTAINEQMTSLEE